MAEVSSGVVNLGCVDDDWWPEDEEDGAPVRPSAPARPAAPVAPDYRPLPVRFDEDDDDPFAEPEPFAASEPEPKREPQIYAPTPGDGRTAVAGVPMSLPPRQAPALPPKPAEPPQFEQVQPGQQVSPEWRREPEQPLDLPQAPESAWAQPPTAPLPIGTPRSASPDVSVPPKPTAPRAPVGVPHQVPPAPMPRPADDLARRRVERRPEPAAEMGLQGAVRRSTFGLISPAPGKREQERHAELEAIERRFGGLRQITVVNPGGRAGKSVAAQMLALTYGQHREEPVLAWDIGETPATLGLRATPRSVNGLADVYAQGAFDVAATDESTLDFATMRDGLGAAYRILVVGTGNDPDSEDWRAAVDATDQLVVAIFGSNESAEAAARMLDYLERVGRVRPARQAVTLLALPQNQRELDAAGIERHFAARTRAVVRIPVDRAVEARPIDYRHLADVTRTAWLKAAAAIAEGL